MLCLFAGGLHSDGARWIYHIYTVEDGGLKLSFEPVLALSATITVVAVVNGASVTVTQTIATDPGHGGGVFPMKIGDFDTFEVKRATIQIGDMGGIYDYPKTGVYYELRRQVLVSRSNFAAQSIRPPVLGFGPTVKQ